MIITLIISCLTFGQQVFAKEFNRNMLMFPDTKLHWLVDMYSIETGIDLSDRDTNESIRAGEVNHIEKSIKISEKVYNEFDQLERIQHEIGHIVDSYCYKSYNDEEFINIFKEEAKDTSNVTQEYNVDKSVNEFFAEMYMLYMLQPDMLLKVAPKAFKYINDRFNCYKVNNNSSITYNDLQNVDREYFHVNGNKIIDSRGEVYNSIILILSKDNELIEWYEKRSINIYKRLFYLKYRFVKLDDYEMSIRQKCYLLNFYLNGGKIDIPFNLRNDNRFRQYLKLGEIKIEYKR